MIGTEITRESLKTIIFLSLSLTISSRAVGAAPLETDWLNLDDVKRCRGIPCEKWDAIQTKLAALKVANTKHNDPDLTLLLGGDQQSINTIDGDIWPTMDVVDMLEEKLRTRHKRKLTVFSDTIQRWEMPIHYYIDKHFNVSQADAIRGAINHWETQTCIRFIEEDFNGATVRQIFAKPFLYFVKDNRCGTFVGRVPDAIAQQIYLSDQCIYQWGAIVHEIGHIVGFWHEHQRSDRDGYIKVFLDRMAPPVDYSQYSEKVTRNLVPYDYGSVMHYWAWSNSPSLSKITLQPTDIRYLYTIGQKVQLSFLDAQLANIEYCSDRCSNAITCNNQGYQDPNNCSRCKCPDGFVGDHCETVAPPEKAECGGTITLAKEQSTYIMSPGYNNNKTYKDFTSCTWLIEAPENQKVKFQIMSEESDHFGMYCQYPVCFHWVEIKTESSDMSVTGPRYCCDSLNKIVTLPGVLTSKGNRLMVLMRSNFTTSSTGSSEHNKGFRAYVWTSADIKTLPADDNPTDNSLVTPSSAPTGSAPQLNLVFVMDSSGSVGAANWIRIKDFAKRVIRKLAADPLDYRLSFVTFGSSGYVNIPLSRHADYVRITDVIDGLPWKMESSNIADGIRKAREEIAGSRPEVPSLVVLVTDGPASAEQSNTDAEARMLKAMDDTYLLVIGLTERVNKTEILALASRPAQKYAEIFDSFQALNDLVDHVTEVAAELGHPDKKPKAATASSITTTTTASATTTTKGYSTTTRKPRSQQSAKSGVKEYTWRCGFEDDSRPLCDMDQEQVKDQFDWTRQSGPTQSSDTGPTGAATGQYYIYTEASHPRKPGDLATIYLPGVPGDGVYCLRYKYNMYGYHIKELRVHIVHSTGETEMLQSKTKQSDVGNPNWLTESLAVKLKGKSKIAFTGVRGAEYSGDIALDDLSLYSGPCDQ